MGEEQKFLESEFQTAQAGFKFVCRHGWIRTPDCLVSIPLGTGITGVYHHICLRTEIWIGVYGFSGIAK